MKMDVLKRAEAGFLSRWPGGFDHPEFEIIAKKHKMPQMIKLTQEAFAPERFDDPMQITDDMIKVVTRASMVAVFEKPKYRDMMRAMNSGERQVIAQALYQVLHGDEQGGFNTLVTFYGDHKMAKWTVMTIIQNYFRPRRDVFVKPTTVKLIINALGLDLHYKARPTWDFYRRYRDYIQEMRAEVDPCLTGSNAAFSGFLMMSLKPDAET